MPGEWKTHTNNQNTTTPKKTNKLTKTDYGCLLDEKPP